MTLHRSIHVTPWPAGATHPGNLRPLCREHHLLKTLKTGWTPTAHPDGTTTWSAPNGHTYTTTPLGPVLFPHNTIDTPIPRTRHITLIGERGNLGDREPDIPRRQRTRQHDRQYRINAERTRNAAELAISFKSDAHHKLE
ncbi:HNH endonuclease signature motif containing protein [Mycolicibacterium neoaurum]|uniref:HNH endonuclease signature motif containing protein n=1 Tax=Mycolicibacterium neoaurum TaxID=1795 RepID=UPI0030842479